MKKAELLEIIRTVVKEEVDQALPQILMEVLAEKIVSGDKPIKQPIQRQPKLMDAAPVRQEVKQPQKVYSSNPILNQILNETQGGIPQEDADAVPSVIDVVRSAPQEVLNENRDVAAVANALTRDYSQMLKVIDAKAKAKRPA